MCSDLTIACQPSAGHNYEHWKLAQAIHFFHSIKFSSLHSSWYKSTHTPRKVFCIDGGTSCLFWDSTRRESLTTQLPNWNKEVSQIDFLQSKRKRAGGENWRSGRDYGIWCHVNNMCWPGGFRIDLLILPSLLPAASSWSSHRAFSRSGGVHSIL